LHIPRSIVNDYARRGVPPSIKVGRHRRFVRSDVAAARRRLYVAGRSAGRTRSSATTFADVACRAGRVRRRPALGAAAAHVADEPQSSSSAPRRRRRTQSWWHRRAEGTSEPRVRRRGGLPSLPPVGAADPRSSWKVPAGRYPSAVVTVVPDLTLRICDTGGDREDADRVHVVGVVEHLVRRFAPPPRSQPCGRVARSYRSRGSSAQNTWPARVGVDALRTVCGSRWCFPVAGRVS